MRSADGRSGQAGAAVRREIYGHPRRIIDEAGRGKPPAQGLTSSTGAVLNGRAAPVPVRIAAKDDSQHLSGLAELPRVRRKEVRESRCSSSLARKLCAVPISGSAIGALERVSRQNLIVARPTAGYKRPCPS